MLLFIGSSVVVTCVVAFVRGGCGGYRCHALLRGIDATLHDRREGPSLLTFMTVQLFDSLSA